MNNHLLFLLFTIIPFTALTQPTYQEVKTIDHHVIISHNNKEGLLDEIGIVIFPAEFDSVRYEEQGSYFKAYKMDEFLAYAPYGELVGDSIFLTDLTYNKRTGYIDLISKQGMGMATFEFNLRVPPIFDKFTIEDAHEIYNDEWEFYIVEKTGKKGIYHRDSLLYPCVYDDIIKYPDDNWFFVKKDGKFGLHAAILEEPGFAEVLPVKYDDIKIKGVGDKEKREFLEVETGGKKGLLFYNDYGNYELVGEIRYDKILVKKQTEVNETFRLIPVKAGKEEGFILFNIYPPHNPFYFKEYRKVKDIIIYKSAEDKWGVVHVSDDKLEESVPAVYDQILVREEYKDQYVPEGNFLAVKKDGKWGLITGDNEIIKEIRYDTISDMR